MDPISQGALGAALAQSGGNGKKVKAATILGCFGGLAPDLDILIFSPADPLLFLEFHRQFTPLADFYSYRRITGGAGDASIGP